MTTRDYEVGFRKPPKANQFKKGQSGNPKGRSKNDDTQQNPILNELKASMHVVEDGKRKKFSKAQLAAKALINKAIRGDIRALKIVMPYIELLTKAKGFGDMVDDDGMPMTREKAIDEIFNFLTSMNPQGIDECEPEAG